VLWTFAVGSTDVFRITVDDTEATYIGPWKESKRQKNQYAKSVHFIKPDHSGRKNDRATWPLAITTDGNYHLSVRSPAYHRQAKNALFSVHQGSKKTDIRISQKRHSGQWQSLGDYSLKQNETNYISLARHKRRFVVADAVRAELISPITLTPPVITTPSNTVIENPYTIDGWTQNDASVLLYNNNHYQQSVTSDSETGLFSAAINLNDGANEIFARTSDGHQESEPSNTIVLNYQNQSPIEYTGSLLDDTVWTADEPEQSYTIVDTLTIEEGVTLTLMPGTRLEFAPDAQLIIKGHLQVLGEEQAPVILTAQIIDPKKIS